MRTKKAAMEMSVGTIVTIVLLMSVLVLGLFLIRGIFSSAKGAMDLTDQELQAEIKKLFAEDSKLAIYPTSKTVKIKVGNDDAIGIGIKNIATNVNSETSFSYTTVVVENNCGLTKEQVEKWISLGKSESDIPIPISEIVSGRVTISIPEGTPNCLARFRVNVQRGSTAYDTDFFEIRVKA